MRLSILVLEPVVKRTYLSLFSSNVTLSYRKELTQSESAPSAASPTSNPETKRVDTFGQTRLAVAFQRLIMPDGYSVSLDQFKGMNQIGDAGLHYHVNNHYFKIFGASLAVGSLEKQILKDVAEGSF